jgi:acetyltransferase-like isoleucine patch superfamily enzyme
LNSSYFLEADLTKLGFNDIGENVLVSKNCKIYGAENLILGNNVRIDDFALISVGQKSRIGNNVHIAAFSGIFASKGIEIGNCAGVSTGVSIHGDSEDLSGKFFTNPTFPSKYRNLNSKRVFLGDYSFIGTRSVLLPGASLSEGSALGAQSLLSKSTDEWSIYFGAPAKKISTRDQNIKYTGFMNDVKE